MLKVGFGKDSSLLSLTVTRGAAADIRDNAFQLYTNTSSILPTPQPSIPFYSPPNRPALFHCLFSFKLCLIVSLCSIQGNGRSVVLSFANITLYCHVPCVHATQSDGAFVYTCIVYIHLFAHTCVCYVYVYVCIYSMCVCTYTYVFAHKFTCTFVHIHVHTNICTSLMHTAYIRTYVHVSMHMYCIRMLVRVPHPFSHLSHRVCLPSVVSAVPSSEEEEEETVVPPPAPQPPTSVGPWGKKSSALENKEKLAAERRKKEEEERRREEELRQQREEEEERERHRKQREEEELKKR